MKWRDADRRLGEWFQMLLDELDPQHCLCCGQRLPRQGAGVALHLCEKCLPPSQGPRCGRCGRPFDRVVESCGPCLLRPPPWARLVVLGDYGGALVPIVHRFKFGGWFFLGEELGRRLAACARNVVDVDAVVPVPMATLRRLRRGFDHTKVLADAVAAELGRPVVPLLRRSWSREQVGLSGRARRRHLGISVRRRRPLPRRVLVVDDVLTTGATLRACVSSLRAAGVESVSAAVVARTPAPSERQKETLGTTIAYS